MTPPITSWHYPQPNAIYWCDALDLLRALPDASIDLILTDWPYNVGKAAWDSWPTMDAYLAWMDAHLGEMRRVLKFNGAYYGFCDTGAAAQVEMVTRRHFNVLNNIRWWKTSGNRNWASDKSVARGYLPNSETVLFAEQYGSDRDANGQAGYEAQYDEAKRQLKYTILSEYLDGEFTRAGVTRREIAELFPSKNGKLTGCVSNWLLGYNIPTAEQYQTMRDFLNNRAGGEYLRREYEDLRREYEDLRRPFSLPNSPQKFTDVWFYQAVQTYEGKHPCEKPMDMMRDIITTSSRPDALVLDCFTGSGNSLRAAHELGRQWIGCDADAHWVRKANEWITAPIQLALFAGAAS